MKCKYFMLLSVGLSILFFNGCSIIKSVGILSAQPVLRDLEESIFMEEDVSVVENGLPSLLLLVSGVANSASGNDYLKLLIAKLCVGYGILIEDEDKDNAIELYERGVDACVEILMENPSFRKSIESGETFEASLKLIHDEKYVPALLFGGLAWGLHILADLGNPMIMVETSKVKALIDRALFIDETYLHGIGYVVLGIYYCIVPSVFTGGTEEARGAFNRAIKLSNGGGLLISRYYFAKYYAVLIKDSKLFDIELGKIIETPSNVLPDIALFNAIAKKKSYYLMENKGKYF